MDYWAGLYYDPAVQGDLYRTDIPEPGLDSGYDEGYADIIDAEVYLFSTNYVEGKTYCTGSTHFVIEWDTRRRYVVDRLNPCITIPVPPPPTPTPTPVPTPTPCPLNLNKLCEDESILIYTSNQNIRPMGVTGGNNKSRVTACVIRGETPVPNREVRFRLVSRFGQTPDSGGHVESLHTGQRPLGKLDSTIGITNANGCVATNFNPPHIAGTVGVDASTSIVAVGTEILVGIPDLVFLYDGENYIRIGSTDAHPSNHWGAQTAVDGLPLIANDYKALFYGSNTIPEQEKLAYNDMSLSYGGKFDLKKTWSSAGAHAEHREGINCDVRSNNVPRRRWAKLNNIFFERGSTRTNDETGTSAPHWHLRFEGSSMQGSSSGMQDGIEQNPSAFVEVNSVERTPHSFVEEVWWGILDRESTQEEWENWHTQIVEAKAQGTSQLLEKAKVFEQQLFISSEYTARYRTDAELVEDVFWSHLFREPTQTESEYWQNYLSNLPPSYTQQRRIQSLLYEIEATTEFQDIILGIVDELPPPE